MTPRPQGTPTPELILSAPSFLFSRELPTICPCPQYRPPPPPPSRSRIPENTPPSPYSRCPRHPTPGCPAPPPLFRTAPRPGACARLQEGSGLGPARPRPSAPSPPGSGFTHGCPERLRVARAGSRRSRPAHPSLAPGGRAGARAAQGSPSGSLPAPLHRALAASPATPPWSSPRSVLRAVLRGSIWTKLGRSALASRSFAGEAWLVTAQPPRPPSSVRGCLVEPGGGQGWRSPPWPLWDVDSGPGTCPGQDSTWFPSAARPVRRSGGSSWLLGLFPRGLLCAPGSRLLACPQGDHSLGKRLQRSLKASAEALEGEGPGSLLVCWYVPQFPRLWGKQH